MPSFPNTFCVVNIESNVRFACAEFGRDQSSPSSIKTGIEMHFAPEHYYKINWHLESNYDMTASRLNLRLEFTRNSSKLSEELRRVWQTGTVLTISTRSIEENRQEAPPLATWELWLSLIFYVSLILFWVSRTRIRLRGVGNSPNSHWKAENH